MMVERAHYYWCKCTGCGRVWAASVLSCDMSFAQFAQEEAEGRRCPECGRKLGTLAKQADGKHQEDAE